MSACACGAGRPHGTLLRLPLLARYLERHACCQHSRQHGSALYSCQARGHAFCGLLNPGKTCLSLLHASKGMTKHTLADKSTAASVLMAALPGVTAGESALTSPAAAAAVSSAAKSSRVMPAIELQGRPVVSSPGGRAALQLLWDCCWSKAASTRTGGS